MSICVTAFTQRGIQLAHRIADALGESTQVWTLERFGDERSGIYQSLSRWTREQFLQKNDLIFVSAAAIAVRSVAPFLQDKFTDPAVLSVDEAGRFVIPLVSGHVGGGNQLARRLASLLGAEAVISTATDVNGRFAIDQWAAENGMTIRNRQAAKRISADILAGRTVYAQCDFPHSPFPEGVEEREPCDFAVTRKKTSFFSDKTLVLHPPVFALGMGCRKGLPEKEILEATHQLFDERELSLDCVYCGASIDLKREDAGMRYLSKELNIPCYFYSAEELNAQSGSFTPSAFVHSVTGVDNVCERSAVAASGGTLLIPKTKFSGITLAVAERSFFADFSPRREEK